MTESNKVKSTAKTPNVYALVRASRCFNCDAKLAPGEIVKLQVEKDEREVLCRKCATLDGLEFLRGGSGKITQLAKKYSQRVFVVMQWSELWKCYERLGLLVEPESIDKAEVETGIKIANRERANK